MKITRYIIEIVHICRVSEDENQIVRELNRKSSQKLLSARQDETKAASIFIIRRRRCLELMIQNSNGHIILPIEKSACVSPFLTH